MVMLPSFTCGILFVGELAQHESRTGHYCIYTRIYSEYASERANAVHATRQTLVCTPAVVLLCWVQQ